MEDLLTTRPNLKTSKACEDECEIVDECKGYEFNGKNPNKDEMECKLIMSPVNIEVLGDKKYKFPGWYKNTNFVCANKLKIPTSCYIKNGWIKPPQKVEVEDNTTLYVFAGIIICFVLYRMLKNYLYKDQKEGGEREDNDY